MKEIKDYEKACEAIGKKFVKKYFSKAYDDSYWIGIGGVFYISDYWFNINEMITALKYKATFEQLTTYYEMGLEIASSKKGAFGKRRLFSFENYLKYPNNFIIEEKNGKMDFRIKTIN